MGSHLHGTRCFWWRFFGLWVLSGFTGAEVSFLKEGQVGHLPDQHTGRIPVLREAEDRVGHGKNFLTKMFLLDRSKALRGSLPSQRDLVPTRGATT